MQTKAAKPRPEARRVLRYGRAIAGPATACKRRADDTARPAPHAHGRGCVGTTFHRPRILQTVRGRGFRFVAAVEVGPASGLAPHAGFAPPSSVGSSTDTAPALLGRTRELDALWALLERTRRGHGGLALLEGPPGIGKSALSCAFARQAAHTTQRSRGAGRSPAAARQRCGPSCKSCVRWRSDNRASKRNPSSTRSSRSWPIGCRSSPRKARAARCRRHRTTLATTKTERRRRSRKHKFRCSKRSRGCCAPGRGPALDQHEQAGAHFERALVETEHTACFNAHVQCEYGRTLLALGRRRRARALLMAAQRSAASFGMQPLRERAAAALADR